MRAAIFNGPHSITIGERPDPTIQAPTDAVVRVVLGCVCGSDLWEKHLAAQAVSAMARGGNHKTTNSIGWG